MILVWMAYSFIHSLHAFHSEDQVAYSYSRTLQHAGILSDVVPLAGVPTGARLSAASAGEVRRSLSICSALTASCLWLVEELGGTISILLAPLATALAGRSVPCKIYASVIQHLQC